MCKHKIEVDKFVKIELEIPETMTIMEWQGLSMKLRKLYTVPEIRTESDTESESDSDDNIAKSFSKPKTNKKYFWSQEELELVARNKNKMNANEFIKLYRQEFPESKRPDLGIKYKFYTIGNHR